jgi:Putative peptidoglycan binding domain
MPRRRRRARSVAVEAEERGLVMRVLLHSPKDMVAGLLAAAATCAIIANALFLQAGRHPSPMFGSVVTMPAQQVVASPLPRPRPVEIVARPVEAEPPESRQAEVRGADSRIPAPAATSAIVVRPPAPVPLSAQSAGARRVAAVQRALTQYGYGQLKPTGAVGADTQAAIQKFERDRKLPVTGQMSDRLVRELTAVIGHPID